MADPFDVFLARFGYRPLDPPAAMEDLGDVTARIEAMESELSGFLPTDADTTDAEPEGEEAGDATAEEAGADDTTAEAGEDNSD